MRKLIISAIVLAVSFFSISNKVMAGDYDKDYKDKHEEYSKSDWGHKDYSFEKNSYKKVNYNEDYRKDKDYQKDHNKSYDKHDYDHGKDYDYGHNKDYETDQKHHSYNEAGFFDLSWFWKLLEHLKSMFPHHFSGLEWKM